VFWVRAALVLVLLATGCAADQGSRDGGADAACFCPDASVVDPFGDASLAIRTRTLFGTTCAGGPESGCHSDSAANLMLRLDPDGGDVIDVPSTELPGLVRVKPFAKDQSYLFWKVTADPRIDGGAMPLDQAFDPRIPALLGAWIDAGAP
jgi:hypothetical protein